MKKILIIQGNPIENSYGSHLAKGYAQGQPNQGQRCVSWCLERWILI